MRKVFIIDLIFLLISAIGFGSSVSLFAYSISNDVRIISLVSSICALICLITVVLAMIETEKELNKVK